LQKLEREELQKSSVPGYEEMIRVAHVKDNEASNSPFFKPFSLLVPKAPMLPNKKQWEKKDNKFSGSSFLSVRLNDILGTKSNLKTVVAQKKTATYDCRKYRIIQEIAE